MSKCLVGFCHSVGFFFLLHSAAGVVCSIHDFVSETKIHGLFTALASEGYEPAKAEGLTTVCANFDWYLIVCTTNAACLNFK